MKEITKLRLFGGAVFFIFNLFLIGQYHLKNRCCFEPNTNQFQLKLRGVIYADLL